MRLTPRQINALEATASATTHPHSTIIEEVIGLASDELMMQSAGNWETLAFKLRHVMRLVECGSGDQEDAKAIHLLADDLKRHYPIAEAQQA